MEKIIEDIRRDIRTFQSSMIFHHLLDVYKYKFQITLALADILYLYILW